MSPDWSCPLPPLPLPPSALLPPLTNQQVKRLMLHCSHCSGRSGVSQWLLETRQSLCCCGEFNLTPHTTKILTSHHHTGWLGELQGFTDLMGSPLSSIHASHTTPPTPPSVLLSSLKWIFWRLFLFEIRAWHYMNNLIKQRLDHPFHAWYQSSSPVWFLAMIGILGIFKIFTDSDRQRFCWVESDPLPLPSPLSMICILPVKYFTGLYVVHTTTTPHHHSTTTTTASSCRAAGVPGKPGVRTSN